MSRYKTYKPQKGLVLIICMTFLCVFSALAVALATMSDTNLQIADNLCKADCARASAESGFDITRLWLNQVSISGLTAETEQYNLLAADFRSTVYEISNITPIDQGPITIIPVVTLDAAEGQNFYAIVEPETLDGKKTFRAEVTGNCGTITRTICGNYELGKRAHNVFDYGLATRGPLNIAGNVALGTVAFNSDIYIESENNDNALTMTGPSEIAGDVYITNPNPILDIGSSSTIGGESGQAAIDNHVFTDTTSTEFPVPNPGYFEQYIQTTYDPNNVLSEYENVRIPANTDPAFGDVTMKGIVFIETPNIVTFSGNTSITGLIVGNGSIDDNSGANQIIFLGTVDSHPVDNLPAEPQFDGVRDETGTFVMAPGFKASFGGNFDTLNGAIAANGVEFFGDAGGTIEGSIINYSDTEMTLTGNSNLFFNRSGTTDVPAGFISDIILKYLPSSYSEVIL